MEWVVPQGSTSSVFLSGGLAQGGKRDAKRAGEPTQGSGGTTRKADRVVQSEIKGFLRALQDQQRSMQHNKALKRNPEQIRHLLRRLESN